jgi:hypothetical protein
MESTLQFHQQVMMSWKSWICDTIFDWSTQIEKAKNRNYRKQF